MLDRSCVQEMLQRLDWSRGFDRERLLQGLLAHRLALPNEFLSAIPPVAVFHSPEQLLQSVPDVVWTIHAEREQRARGRVEIPQATQRMRQR